MPVRVMDEIGVRPGMTVADVGAGDGWFTFYLAERVGSSGRVIAEDIDAQALEAVRERCAQEKVSNVSVLVGGMEDPKLPAGAVDLALMVNVLSALGNAKNFLGNLAKGLKPDGRLVVIDWNPVKLYPEMAEQETKSALRADSPTAPGCRLRGGEDPGLPPHPDHLDLQAAGSGLR